MASQLQIWLAQAQADYDRYLPDLERVEQLLKETPLDPALLHRHKLITWYVTSLSDGIEIIKLMIEKNGQRH